MAAVPNAAAEDDAFTFDLGNIFYQNEVEVDELNGTFVGDSDLIDLMNRVNENNKEFQQKPPAVEPQADDI